MTPVRPSIFAASLVAAAALLSPSNAFTAETGSDGWQPLFNGKNLDGWYVFLREPGEKNADPNKLVQVHDGAVHMYKDAAAESTQPFGYISTEKEYANYQLRLQYKWGEKKFAPRTKAKRDAGLLYHHAGPEKVWPTTVECQIQEGDTGDIWAVPVTRVTATVDPKTVSPVVTTNRTGVVRTNFTPVFLPGGEPFIATSRVIRNPENEVEGWNTVEVIIRGDSAIHIVNGKTNNVCSHMEAKIGDNWVPLKKGRIALQLEGAEVFYRNIEIKQLKD